MSFLIWVLWEEMKGLKLWLGNWGKRRWWKFKKCQGWYESSKSVL